MNEYNFPVNDVYDAMEVTSPNFAITEVKDWEEKLYVEGNFNTFQKCFEDYSFLLGIEEDKHLRKARKFQKAIFYGHKGTGKSTLLFKFKEYLEKKTEYLPVYINLIDFFEVADMQKEDVYVAIVSAFLQTMDRAQIPVQDSLFKEIINEWLQGDKYEKEVEKLITVEPSVGVKVESGTGLPVVDNFLKFLKVEAQVKGLYSIRNNVTETIRRSINQNSKTLIEKLNRAFAILRASYFKGKQDLIFVIDGLEKARPDVYKELFIDDIALINLFDAHAIYCVPIRTFYDLSNRHTREDLQTIYLPLYRNTEAAKSFFFSLIEKRIDNRFWADKEAVLTYFFHYAAGSPRQFFVFVNRALLMSRGKPITLEIAQSVINKEAIEMRRPLYENHVAELTKKTFQHLALSDALLDLMVNLCVIEYNGTNIERKMNPLLARDFYNELEFEQIYSFSK